MHVLSLTAERPLLCEMCETLRQRMQYKIRTGGAYRLLVMGVVVYIQNEFIEQQVVFVLVYRETWSLK